jgi:hypothetical protein
MEIPADMVDDRPSGASEQTAPPGPKRPYKSPELVEWGSIVDLTRGPIASFEDVDNGGSQQV